ncbi:hypothetical protein [Nocardia sp. CDC160]|uniref:hypothetical protein n=1 Tax=Nocardia sp. CDC160 TaxID=3112166 RepID=UPI002DBB305E|nr:hypothetical protein [Nocardia sp. CDC160]MEC3918991.1 hypothetical protein [Nocardia sp. CDC160]
MGLQLFTGPRAALAGALAAGAVLALPACGNQDGVLAPSSTPPSVSHSAVPTSPGELVPPQNSRSVSAPSAISPAQLRHKTCEDLLPRMDRLRSSSGQQAVDQAVADAIANFPNTADWSVLTPEQQQAAVDGAHDSGTGKC